VRYIEYREDKGYLSMGIDEVLLILRGQNKIEDTFRFYSFNPSCVSIGYFQRIDFSIDLDFCKKNNIDYVRRITGGGNVFHDKFGEITYSMIISEKKAPENILESFEFLYGGIISGLKKLNIKAEFKPLNDLTLNSKKISGSAQTRRNGTILQHGTIIYDTSIDTMEKALKISEKKIEIRNRLTTLNNEGYKYKKEILINALKEGFKDIFGSFEESIISKEELLIATNLANEKYRSENWNYLR